MKKIEFKLPDGVQIPEGKGPGDRIKVMAEIELKDKGSACLASIDDQDMPGYSEDKTESETPKDSGGFMGMFGGDQSQPSQGGY